MRDEARLENASNPYRTPAHQDVRTFAILRWRIAPVTILAFFGALSTAVGLIVPLQLLQRLYRHRNNAVSFYPLPELVVCLYLPLGLILLVTAFRIHTTTKLGWLPLLATCLFILLKSLPSTWGPLIPFSSCWPF
jgi:hypothetical protein